jgi:branched-chain amino acid transport system ATP-binding protein
MLPNRGQMVLWAESLVTGYSKKRVVNGISVNVRRAEIVALLGHNGAGKSTLLKAIFGLLPLWEGEIHFRGVVVRMPRPRTMLRQGMSFVPQGNRVFEALTVMENLEVGGSVLNEQRRLAEEVDRVLSIFPALRTRARHKASALSGGEKQMLALANSLVLSPSLLLLDEPSLGLSPHSSAEIFELIERLRSEFEVSTLVVEQKVREILKLADRVYVLRNGAVTYSGTPEMLQDENQLRAVYL